MIKLRNTLTAISILVLASACSVPPTVSTAQKMSDPTKGPYENVLVLALFTKFDTRRYLEDEVVKYMAANGVKATASTSMMTTKTPLTRAFIVELMTELGSDALLLTQLADLETTEKVVDMNPEVTYNVRPTYYFNVFTVEQTEYIEPQDVRFTHYLSTTSDLYSFSDREIVWSTTTHSKIKENVDHMRDYSIYVREAAAIGAALIKDGVVSN